MNREQVIRLVEGGRLRADRMCNVSLDNPIDLEAIETIVNTPEEELPLLAASLGKCDIDSCGPQCVAARLALELLGNT